MMIRRKDLAVHQPPAGRAPDKGEHGGIEHDLDADQDHDEVGAPGNGAGKPQDEDNAGKDENMGKGNNHCYFLLPRYKRPDQGKQELHGDDLHGYAVFPGTGPG